MYVCVCEIINVGCIIFQIYMMLIDWGLTSTLAVFQLYRGV